MGTGKPLLTRMLGLGVVLLINLLTPSNEVVVGGEDFGRGRLEACPLRSEISQSILQCFHRNRCVVALTIRQAADKDQEVVGISLEACSRVRPLRNVASPFEDL